MMEDDHGIPQWFCTTDDTDIKYDELHNIMIESFY